MKFPIEPHGGRLIDRRSSGIVAETLDEKAKVLPRVVPSAWEISDLEMIATGGFSPLEGFMLRDDYESVLDVKRLANGLPWTIPVTLAVEKPLADSLKEGSDVALADSSGVTLAVLHLEEKFAHDREKEAVQVFGTRDSLHPGVKRVISSPEVLLGGKVSVIRLPKHSDFLSYRLEPAETRRRFRERGWKRVAGFQTRNPIHRAHEYIQKCALETVDGLFVHPLVGETKEDDLPADVRIRSYEVVLSKYYPKDRTLLGVLPMAMRYAGPREAILHAIVRKNYGCTHFIVGRDHAGVGQYYGPFDAHYIFDEFDEDEIGIRPLFFDNAFYCKTCSAMATFKTCPHDSGHHLSLSGTKVRELLSRRTLPPVEVTRPEVAEVLIEALATPDFQI